MLRGQIIAEILWEVINYLLTHDTARMDYDWGSVYKVGNNIIRADFKVDQLGQEVE